MKNYMADAAPGTTKPGPSAAVLPRDPGMRSVSGDEQGTNAPPTRAAPASRSASPDAYTTSGLERAMSAHADRVHPLKGGRRGA